MRSSRAGVGGRRRAGPTLVAGFLVLVALVAGCATVPDPNLPTLPVEDPLGGQGGFGGEGADAIGPATGPPRPSAGCAGGEDGAFSGSRPLTVGDQQREYLLHVPASLTAGQPAPLVVELHGLGNTATLQRDISAWPALADREGVVVAHPQGTGNLWNFVPDDANPDAAFVRQVVATIGKERCIDESRVYASGISMGALVASVLACRPPQIFAAFGLVAGLQYKPACTETPPRPFVVFWGTSDCVLPYFGGTGPCLAVGERRPQPTGPVPPEQDNGLPPVEQVAAEWAEHNGCQADVQEQLTASVTRRARRDCEAGATVELYVIEGGSHSWPGSELMTRLDAQRTSQAGGSTTTEIDATAIIWDFFLRHQLNAG